MWSTGINRNIVECKGMYCSPAISYRCVLIETLWNVKDYRLKRILDTQKVLIETLWNVKIELTDLHLVDRFVLIETLWNVKNYEGLTGGEK